jgi:hypothetical protein
MSHRVFDFFEVQFIEEIVFYSIKLIKTMDRNEEFTGIFWLDVSLFNLK